MTASSPPSRAESVPQLQIELLRDAHEAGQRLEAIAERTGSGQSREVTQRVEAILEQVQAQGDAALFELTERFDGVRPDPLRVPQEEIEAAWAATPPDLQEALALAHRRILDFHQRQLPNDLAITGEHGERLGRRWRPVERAGLYVPGGRASYPSTVLMNAVPAKVAGVQRVVMVTCLLYTSPSPRDVEESRMPSSA